MRPDYIEARRRRRQAAIRWAAVRSDLLWRVERRRENTVSAMLNRAVDETARKLGFPREVVQSVLWLTFALFAGSFVGIVAFVAVAMTTGQAAWMLLAPATIAAALLAASRRMP